MVENFLSLSYFQGGIKVLEKDEKGKYLKSSFKKNKKVDTEESNLLSNIFDDANLGNITDEPGSHLTIIDAPTAGDTGLAYSLGDRGNNIEIRTLRVWYIFRGNFVV
ncbi:hypothetical protein RDI58_024639 [Solanum bulbocastanum]|uniref:Uncharacterized protein n=1 Tax=Solanum bulbocastanum TaxID=147425 RepID=A0AAN8T6A0_SOLBU